jgi:hypothetical protein
MQKEPLLGDAAKPNIKLMKNLIEDDFRFERRKYIFLAVNTITMVIDNYI